MNKPVKFIYLAGKYTEPAVYLVQRNIALAQEYAQEIAIMGALPVTPHLLSANMDGIQDYQWWCDTTMELMRRCDAVLMLPNYQESKGAMAELKEAMKLEMPVFYWLHEVKEWINGQQPVDPDYVPLSPEALAKLQAGIESAKSGNVVFRNDDFRRYADTED